MWIDIITEIVIPLVSILIAYRLIPYIREKTTKEQRENIYFYVKLAVSAAEQIYDYNHAGEDKKQYVLEYINKLGLKITEEDLNVMIEAAVKELKDINEV